MNIIVKRLTELHKPEKNVRIHTKKQIEEYIRSIDMFGQIRPIVIDETGEIIAGNGLYDALVQSGRETCECYIAEGLTDAQKKKLMLADNKVFELGLTDTEAFEDILKDIGTDFDIPGYDASMLEMLSMSFTDVDDYIVSYGAFEEPEVDRIAGKTTETHVEGVATGVPAYPVSEPISNIPQAQMPAQGSSNVNEATPAERFVTCPRCGERIPLPEGM